MTTSPSSSSRLSVSRIGVREHLPASASPLRARLGGLVVVGSLVIVALNIGQSYLANRKYCVHDWMHASAHRKIGEMIGEMIPNTPTIVANEIGAIRYYAEAPVVDMLGLTDATVSAIRFESFQKYGIGSSEWSATKVADYLLGRVPGVVVLPADRKLDLDRRERHGGTMHPLWYAIFTHPDFIDGYKPARVIRIHESKFMYLFVRYDVPVNNTAPLPSELCFEMVSP